MAAPGHAPQSMIPQGPPWPPQVWGIGGIPKKSVDLPILSVFLALFIIGAVVHMIIFQINRKRDHKFLFSLAIFVFCMARIATCVLRIAATSLPSNIKLGIAAQIFVAAGVLILFIVNLIFAHRILRALHPALGWHRLVTVFLRTIYVLIVFTLAIVIAATVQSFYTLRPRTRTIDRDLQLYASTFLTIISFLPIPMVLIALAVPHSKVPEKFGTGRFRTKVIILLTGTTLICLGAAFRCGTAWKKPVPRSRPMPGYFSKACLYIFNFVVEILVVYLYAIMRVDLRFYVPDGAKGPESYERNQTEENGAVEPKNVV
ncbi:hypothetical protein CC78DRAFT_284728 [Lojkania enalia]|uniref:Family c-likeg-protein-coupled receptor protein n=1 Tax=Lojkania enalia TaxID=147567 RepID=A0A9P4N5H9_9PLEO|nr:hypothetical protein CC78DRAFT_284728 [Didymosphaeria enalia]